MTERAVPGRREFIQRTGGIFAALPVVRLIRLPIVLRALKPARLAVITDLHFGLAPDALSRFKAFLAAAGQRRFDAMLQMGDFCYADAGAAECLALWNSVKGRKLSILGNHDLDKCDKPAAMKAFGMKTRYYTHDIGGYRLVFLDLNNFRKDGVIVPYANGNYFTENATFNLADAEQLAWLRSVLEKSDRPVVVFSHQPLGFGEPGKPLPQEQTELFALFTDVAMKNPAGKVVACLSGHLHVDRLEYVAGIPCVLVNSASYFWSSGMYPYSAPLYAFMEFTADGMLVIEGRTGDFAKQPPAASDKVAGRSATISSRSVRTMRSATGASP